MKIKGTGSRLASNPDQEPNFYLMDPCPASSSTDWGDVTGERVGQGISFVQQQSQQTAKVVSPIATSPATVTGTDQQREEQVNDTYNIQMPPLELPQSALLSSSNNHITNENSHLASKLEVPPTNHPIHQKSAHTAMTVTSIGGIEFADLKPQSGMESEFPAEDDKQKFAPDDPTGDLRYVFGGMPFHSLIPDSRTIPSTYIRRNSCFDPSADSDDSAPTMGKENRRFEREMEHVADLLEEQGDCSSDIDISHILDMIVDGDTLFYE